MSDVVTVAHTASPVGRVWLQKVIQAHCPFTPPPLPTAGIYVGERGLRPACRMYRGRAMI
eukprot:6194869-Pleurochrysis_carterae.AAC.2